MGKLSVLFGIGTALLSAGIWGASGLLLAAAVLLAAAAVWGYRLYALVEVPELEAAVVFTPGGGSFRRFLPSGRHWINPLRDEIQGTIHTGGQSTSGRCQQAQTSGGIPINLDWTAHFQIDPRRIDRRKAAKLVRTLPEKGGQVVAQHLNHILHHILSQITIEELLQPGIHERLERTLRPLLRERLNKSGLTISRVMVTAIHKPPQIVAAIETAHRLDLQTEQEARALERLHKVISQFTDEEMRRLMELERVHALGQSGAAWLHPSLADEAAAALFTPRRRAARQTVIVDPGGFE